MTISIRDWLALKPETRQALAKIFRLNRSSFTHVVDNHVESDGYTYQDLSAITVEEMKAITHLESDNFEDQFKLIVKMVEGSGDGPIIRSEVENVINQFKAEEKNATNEPSTTPGADSGRESGSKAKTPAGKK